MGVTVGDLNYLSNEGKCLLRSGKDWGGLVVGLGVVGSNVIGGRAELGFTLEPVSRSYVLPSNP